MSFSTLGLSPALLTNIAAVGYTKPTPIQSQVIPKILKGEDVVASAPTGTGKTAAFVLPLLHKLEPTRSGYKAIQTLVLLPTRELAIQVGQECEALSAGLEMKILTLLGGVKVASHKKALEAGADMLIATPGRIIELLKAKIITLHQLSTLVLDEADTMLDMGFIKEVNQIIELMPQKRQILMFSAAFTSAVNRLAHEILRDPKYLDLSIKSGARTITQEIIRVDTEQKSALLAYMIGSENMQQVLVFTRTKEGADSLVKELALDGIKAFAMHGDKTQGARQKALLAFKEREIAVLVATDIAARGLDITGLDVVINFELPHKAQEYIHRIGRTGRAGKSGKALSFVGADDYKHLQDIERIVGKQIPQKTIEGFEPKVPVKKLSRNGKGLTKKAEVSGAFGKPKPKEAKTKKVRGKRAIFGPPALSKAPAQSKKRK